MKDSATVCRSCGRPKDQHWNNGEGFKCHPIGDMMSVGFNTEDSQPSAHARIMTSIDFLLGQSA